MTINTIVRKFKKTSCAVFGAKGSGKDLLFANVVARRHIPYVSNTDYGGEFYPLELDKLDCGGNTYRNFIEGNLKPYTFPYPDGTDVYIADVGVYFPSQYCNELNRDYKSLTVFEALSRHVGQSKLHYNVQALNRAWDKLREQCETYILCLRCFVIGGIVFQKIRIYESYQSAVAKAIPWRIKAPLLASKETKQAYEIQELKYYNSYGRIIEGWIVYRNKAQYDTRVFKKLLQEATE